ncbi:MAG TPA: ATP-binding protein [Polyangiaceae bacterium]|nr:ATP-binding protein [Polyangiaceae bacterium]
MQAGASPELLAAFEEHDRDVRLRYSKVGLALIIALVPAGASLDWMVYPEQAKSWFFVRLLVTALAAVTLALHYTAFSRQHIRWLAMLSPLAVNASICWMVYRSEGAVSPYYAGLNLVLAGVGVLLPWSFGEAAIACGFSLGAYFAACAAHGNIASESSLFYNNVYFLVLTSIICVTAAYFKSKFRFEEFRLSSELARSYQHVSELERLRTEFFANVSHELRTPLTLILSPLSDLETRRAELAGDMQELVRVARDNSLRLLKLISNLLEVARLESGEFTFRAEPLELGQFVTSQAETVRPLARLKNLELLVEPSTERLWVTADPVHVEKILVNLLINAIKFTPRGGTVSVKARREDDSVVVEVQDTGIGISAQELPHIFDRFRQAGGAGARRLSGVGIGLSLAKQLTEEHGGSLDAESRVGKGSTFTLRLPVRAENAVLFVENGRCSGSEVKAAHSLAPAGDSLAQIFHDADRFTALEDDGIADVLPANQSADATVLVIDDEPDMRRYLASILKDQYRVFQAASGEEGLELAARLEPDLVLLDLMMPGIDGWNVCAELKRAAPSDAPKVVVITARTDEMAKIAALKQGADDFISKPFSTLEVRTRLANLQRTRELERSLHDQNQELRSALEKLQTAENSLIQREKMRAVVRLAGGILHEINNPLNYTLTAVGIAAERHAPPNSELAQILDDVRAGMLRIRDIVSDLRSFANPIVNHTYEAFDLEELVDQALRFTAGELTGVRVERSVRQECPAYGSKSQLLQVLTNLLLNAAAAVRQVAGERDPTIRIEAEARANGVRVRLRDNGGGIPPEIVDKVFDPFLTTREVGQGLGLGLSICHALIAAHGGEIRVQSQHGSWTEITFEFPVVERGAAA